MKSDIDRLMAARDLAAIIVAGDEHVNPYRHYLTNGADVTGGLVIKKHGADPVMIVNGMEIEEAAKSGLTVYSQTDLGWHELVKEAEGSRTKAQVAFWGRCLEKLEVKSGKIGVYGVGDLNVFIELMRLMNPVYQQYEFVGEVGTTLFDEAYSTKDADELKRLQSVAVRTGQVLQAAWDYIAGCRADGETVVKADGTALTIGDVKRFVRRELLDHDLEDRGMIFAQGRDAGYPHSRGEKDVALRLGQSIVFDLFPQEIGGGYYHDVTRTWCIGYASEAVRKTYETVIEAFDISVEVFGVGKPTHLMQEAVLDHFESKGHPTGRSQPTAQEGYVHTLGHGIGLNVHERPSISHVLREDTFQVGTVVTIEPGLYYPEQGYGVRVEDTMFVNDSGELISLTDFRKDLILPLNT